MTGTKPTFPWLACHRPNPRAALRLFCFPYAGGGAPIYRNWVEGLPPEVEVCPVQLPGRGGRLRERPFTQMAPLAEAVAADLRAYLDKPFAFFGHSMGAIIGFEVARVLRREGAPQPRYLFASGRAAPQIPRPDPLTYDLPEAEFIEELRRLNGTPPEVLEHPELMQVMLPLVRADFELIQTYDYTPGPPLDCPISVAGGLEDEGVSREQLEAWREQTTASFKLRMYPGDHFFIQSAQPQLLRMLAQELAQGGLLARA